MKRLALIACSFALLVLLPGCGSTTTSPATPAPVKETITGITFHFNKLVAYDNIAKDYVQNKVSTYKTLSDSLYLMTITLSDDRTRVCFTDTHGNTYFGTCRFWKTATDSESGFIQWDTIPVFDPKYTVAFTSLGIDWDENEFSLNFALRNDITADWAELEKTYSADNSEKWSSDVLWQFYFNKAYDTEAVNLFLSGNI